MLTGNTYSTVLQKQNNNNNSHSAATISQIRTHPINITIFDYNTVIVFYHFVYTFYTQSLKYFDLDVSAI